jgi:hypothetical protein
MPKGVCTVAGVLFGVVALPVPPPPYPIAEVVYARRLGRLRAWPILTQALGRNAKTTTTL